MKNKKDPYDIKYFDEEEKELIESIENSEWQIPSAKKLKKRIDTLKKAADNFAKKNERINIRLSSQDLKSIKMTAAREGMPYQTLIASLITRYNNGMLVLRS